MKPTPRTRKRRNIGKKWNKDDTDKLIKFYSRSHNDDLAKMFRRTAGAINTKAYQLGLKKAYDEDFRPEIHEPRRWSEREMKALKKIYNKYSLEELSDIFGRRASAIAAHAGQHRIKKISWTEKQIKFLLKNYRTMEQSQIAKAVGKTATAVRLKLRRLGLRKNDCYYWTPQEDTKLKEMYKNHSFEEMTKEMGRTIVALKFRARKINAPRKLTLWSKEESEYVARNYSRMSPAKIAEKLNRTVDAIHTRGNYLGLKNVKYLTEKEIAYINSWYYKKSIKDIAKSLNRCEAAVLHHAKKMGLSKSRRWTTKEIEKLTGLYKQGVPVRGIAKRLGRSYIATNTKLTMISLERNRH